MKWGGRRAGPVTHLIWKLISWAIRIWYFPDWSLQVRSKFFHHTVDCHPHFRNSRKLRWKWYQTLVSCIGRNYPQYFEIHFVRFGFIPVSKNRIFWLYLNFCQNRTILLIKMLTLEHKPPNFGPYTPKAQKSLYPTTYLTYGYMLWCIDTFEPLVYKGQFGRFC